MIQGSNMTMSHKGMRKGISLVEMLVAIVLFGIIGTISYTYYKNYYDTSFAAKQLRIYTIVDQAAQLSNAFDLYNTKNGQDIDTIDDLVSDRILTQVPVNQGAVSDAGWRYEENLTISGTDATGVAFLYDINSTTAANQDKLDYCNILNEVADATWDLDTNDTSVLGAPAMYALGDGNGSREFEYFHCADFNTTADYDYTLIFVKRATTN